MYENINKVYIKANHVDKHMLFKCLAYMKTLKIVSKQFYHFKSEGAYKYTCFNARRRLYIFRIFRKLCNHYYIILLHSQKICLYDKLAISMVLVCMYM